MSSQLVTDVITSRSVWVARKLLAFMPYFRQLTLLQLEESLEKSQADICLQDEMMREKYKGDEETLAIHISHMNMVKANSTFLRESIFPAMKDEVNNSALRIFAITKISEIKAEFDFMAAHLK